jgi:hypothetical protein
MKTKILMLMLVLTSISNEALCQQTIVDLPNVQQNRTERMFNTQRIGSGKKRFDFVFPQGNRMIIEISSESQVDSIPDVDQLIQSIWKDLQAVDDSLNSELTSKRIDVLLSGDKRIRVQEFPQQGAVYRVKGDDITQLKVEQDTLHLILMTRSARKFQNFFPNELYYISFLVNHISDIPEMLRQQPVMPAINAFKEDFRNRKKIGQSSTSFIRYFAQYDVASAKRSIPLKGDIRGVGQQNNFIPYVQLGIQYIRGSWVPSAGAGVELIKRRGENLQRHYRLFWEPYLFYNRDSLKSVSLNRNDFITFKYYNSSKYNNGVKEIQFVENISVGYLIRRKGNEFEPVTFKFSLPGLQTKNVLLEPEFIFNKFIKDFSPSLKLTLFFD